MSRYLTPHKIGLLALTVLYIKNEQISPTAIVPILSFLIAHIFSRKIGNSSHGAPFQAHGLDLTLESFEMVLDPLEAKMPGRSLWDYFLTALWQIHSMDELHKFFDNLCLFVTDFSDEGKEQDSNDTARKGKVANTSPLGILIRRSHLEFARLRFQDSFKLWQAFVDFRSPSLHAWRRRNPWTGQAPEYSSSQNANSCTANPWGIDLSCRYMSPSKNASTGCNPSNEDVEKFFEFQIERIQGSGARLDNEMIQKLHSMINDESHKSSLSYYISFVSLYESLLKGRFLDAWKGGDYNSSFESLHKYFDYTMHTRDRVFYQYALLNLAVLQADFGAKSEAISAMLEAVATARTNQDLPCLNYSLCWLFHFGQAHPDCVEQIREKGVLAPDREALTFLKAKAKETGMWNIFSSATLSEANLFLKNGDSIQLALQNALKASHTNLIKGVTTALGAHLAIESVSFARLGVSCQSQISDELLGLCYQDSILLEDEMQSKIRLATQSSLQGRQKEASSYLLQFSPKIQRTLNLSRQLSIQNGIHEMRRCLLQDKLEDAEEFFSQIIHTREINEALRFEIDILRVELDIKLEGYPAALENLEVIANRLRKFNGDICQRIRTMMLKARILELSDSPQRGLSVTLRAATLAYRARIIPLLWEAVERLAVILLSLSEFEAVLTLLHEVMPRTLEYNDCRLSGSYYSLMADAYAGLAGQASITSRPCRNDHLRRVTQYLELAMEQFNRIDHVEAQCELLAKKATVLRLHGDDTLAGDCLARRDALHEGVNVSA